MGALHLGKLTRTPASSTSTDSVGGIGDDRVAVLRMTDSGICRMVGAPCAVGGQRGAVERHGKQVTGKG